MQLKFNKKIIILINSYQFVIELITLIVRILAEFFYL